MGISVFLHQIPCWAELCELLATMSDKEIHDLLSEAWNNGTHIKWGDESTRNGGISKFIPWNADKNIKKSNKLTERFSAALRHIHSKKINGDYVSKDVDIQLKCGGKNGKFWKLKTSDRTYTVSYGKLYNNTPQNPNTMTKTFSTADECYKEAQKKIREKKKKKYKLDWDKNANVTQTKYTNQYLALADKMDKMTHKCESMKKQFANVIGITMNGLFDSNICGIISEYCNEDKIDHYDCDKAFDDIGCPNTPIARLTECVQKCSDKSPSAFGIHLMEGIYGKGQEFGKDVCYGTIRVFSPKEMKVFATRMIKRLSENGVCNIGGISLKVSERSESGEEPSMKRRKLNDSEIEDMKEVFGDEVIYKVAYALSASGIFEKKRQEIVWSKVFRLSEDKFPESTYEGNHSLCAFSFGLNAAAMNRGVIAHYW